MLVKLIPAAIVVTLVAVIVVPVMRKVAAALQSLPLW